MNGKRRRFQCWRMSLAANNGSPWRTGSTSPGHALATTFALALPRLLHFPDYPDKTRGQSHDDAQKQPCQIRYRKRCKHHLGNAITVPIRSAVLGPGAQPHSVPTRRLGSRWHEGGGHVCLKKPDTAVANFMPYGVSGSYR